MHQHSLVQFLCRIYKSKAFVEKIRKSSNQLVRYVTFFKGIIHVLRFLVGQMAVEVGEGSRVFILPFSSYIYYTPDLVLHKLMNIVRIFPTPYRFEIAIIRTAPPRDRNITQEKEVR